MNLGKLSKREKFVIALHAIYTIRQSSRARLERKLSYIFFFSVFCVALSLASICVLPLLSFVGLIRIDCSQQTVERFFISRHRSIQRKRVQMRRNMWTNNHFFVGVVNKVLRQCHHMSAWFVCVYCLKSDSSYFYTGLFMILLFDLSKQWCSTDVFQARIFLVSIWRITTFAYFWNIDCIYY